MEVFSDYLQTVLTSFITQVLWILIPVIVFGFLISFCNRNFYKSVGDKVKPICYATGFIGTPIHELSHAVMCLIFGHKIKEIKLFQVGSADGTLGYVTHVYNKKNLYHRVGNFFIGIAPIYLGSLFLIFLMWVLVPTMSLDIFSHLSELTTEFDSNQVSVILTMFGTFFTHFANPLWWVYVVLGLAVSLHMTLSKADIEGSKEGIIALILVFFVVNLALGFSSTASMVATSYVTFAGMLIILIMLLALMFVFCLMIIAVIIRAIINASRKAKR